MKLIIALWVIIAFWNTILGSSSIALASEDCIDVDYNLWVGSQVIREEIDIAVNHDGTILAVSKIDGIRLYDTDSLEEIRILERGKYPAVFDIEWSPNTNILADASFRYPEIGLPTGVETHELLNPASKLRLWDADTGQIVNSIDTETDAVSWSYDGELLVHNEMHGGLRGLVVVNSNLETIAELDIQPIVDQIVWLSDNSGFIAISEGWQSLSLWLQGNDLNYIETDNWTSYVATNPNITEIATVSINHIELWDLDDREKVAEIYPQNPTNIFTAEWSEDGEILAFSSIDGLYIWQPPDLDTLIDYTSIAPPAYRIAWLPDRTALFFSDFDGNVYKWDIESECVVDLTSYNIIER